MQGRGTLDRSQWQSLAVGVKQASAESEPRTTKRVDVTCLGICHSFIMVAATTPESANFSSNDLAALCLDFYHTAVDPLHESITIMRCWLETDHSDPRGQ